MTPSIHNLPLKIIHNFPYAAHASLDEKKATVTRVLLDLKSRGFGGIVSNVCTRSYTLDPEEWEVFSHVADECERLGMRLWIYDEDGYPSSGASGLTLAENPDYEATGVVMIKEAIAPGETKAFELPRGHQHFLWAAVYACDGEGALIPDDEGSYPCLDTADCRYGTEAVTLTNPLSSPAVACVFIRKPLYEGTHCVHNVFECRRYIDLTNRDAVAAFLRNTYDRYAAVIPQHMTAGAGHPAVPVGQIEAFFTDEPSFMGCYINKGLYPNTIRDPYDDEMPLYPVLSYGRDVENAFFTRYGYDLIPEFLSIFLGETQRAKSVRYDYYTLMSDLYEQSFFVQISDWCARHKVSFSGHLLLEDQIKYHTVFEGNYFDLLRHMHYPGIDMLHSIPSVVRQYAFTPKLISSVAHAYDRPHVMSEVSAHAQGGKVTQDQMYASLCAQYALGVDIFTYYYSESFMDPETYTRYNHALGRIDAIMAGKHKADVLFYYPIETFRIYHKPSDAQYGAYTEEENACEEGLTTLMNALLDEQVDFDFADSRVLASMTVDAKGRLKGRNGETYAALVLPPMAYTPDMCTLLTRLKAQGVSIVAYTPGGALCPDFAVCYGKAEDIPHSAALADRALMGKGAAHGVLRLMRDTQNGRACLLVNTNDSTVTAAFTVCGMTQPMLYDPMNDCALPCTFTQTAQGHEFTVELEVLQSLIVKEAE